MDNKKIITAISLLSIASPLMTAFPTLTQSASSNHEQDGLSKHDVLINLEDHQTVSSMLSALNKQLNIFMPLAANKYVAYETQKESNKFISQTSFNNLVSYTSNLNFSNPRVGFQFQGNTLIYDFTKVQNEVQIIKQKLQHGYENSMPSSYRTKKMMEAIFNKLPNMATMIGAMMGMNFGLEMTGFMAIPNEGYDNYLNMLDAYHNFTWSFLQSTVYQNWLDFHQNKPIYQLMNKQNGQFKSYEVRAGQEFDAANAKSKFGITTGKPKFENELNNLEAQLVLSITNLYALVI